MNSIQQRMVAIASGKGGVGKTTTSANLALYYAKKGYNTALIDLDPLSDIATLFDLPSDNSASETSFDSLSPGDDISRYTISLFHKLDLLFPDVKLDTDATARIFDYLFSPAVENQLSEYDIVLLDLAAGYDESENIAFAEKAKLSLIVTNPEPTAHVAAGHYFKALEGRKQNNGIAFWHNKYSDVSDMGFDPRNVVRNYNKNVPEEERIDTQFADTVPHFAFIPRDETLDLLSNTPSPVLSILEKLSTDIDMLHEEIIREVPIPLKLNPILQEMIILYIKRNPDIGEIRGYIKKLGKYILTVMAMRTSAHLDHSGIVLFTDDESRQLMEYLAALKKYAFLNDLIKLQRILQNKVSAIYESGKLFTASVELTGGKALDRELSSILIHLNKRHRSNGTLKNIGGVLLFHFSLYKLLQSQTAVSLIENFIPYKQGPGGQKVRNRRDQMKNLLEKNESYRKKYFSLIKTLQTVVNRQLQMLITTFELKYLIFGDKNGKTNTGVYLNLLSNFLHDTIYSGLSILVGFDYRPSSVSFSEAAEHILKDLGITTD